MKSCAVESEVERQFGMISEEFTERGSGSQLRVFRLDNNPTEGLTSLITCGLSNLALMQESGAELRAIQQELVVSVPTQFGLKGPLDALFSLAESAIDSKKAFEFGETIKINLQTSAAKPFDGFLCIEPPFWDQEEVSLSSQNAPIIFVYLMPIFSDELVTIRRLGISEFLSMIERLEIDIVDPERPQLV